MILDYREFRRVFREYVDKHFDEIRNTKYEDIENKILAQHDDPTKKAETLILMIYLLSFNEETDLGDYGAKNLIYVDLILNGKYLKKEGVRNYMINNNFNYVKGENNDNKTRNNGNKLK